MLFPHVAWKVKKVKKVKMVKQVDPVAMSQVGKSKRKDGLDQGFGVMIEELTCKRTKVKKVGMGGS